VSEVEKKKPVWRARLDDWFESRLYLLASSLGRLHRAPLGSFLTVLVIAIALALPACFQSIVKNLGRLSGELEATNRISLYLKPDLADEAGRKLAARLAKHPAVAEAAFVSKESGLEELKTFSGFGEAMRALDYNPLPAVVNIRPKDSLGSPEQAEKLAAELRAFPEADFVQLDMEWLRKLHALLNIAQRIADALNGLLGMAVLFIVGNTIRLDLQNRAEEIAVSRLMGATDRFIRRPFLYAGFWYGILGGCLAWLLVGSLLLSLRGPVRELAGLYGGDFDLSLLDWAETGRLLIGACALGVFGAWLTAFWHLRRLES
jgi:cell division transport system permease protein